MSWKHMSCPVSKSDIDHTRLKEQLRKREKKREKHVLPVRPNCCTKKRERERRKQRQLQSAMR